MHLNPPSPATSPALEHALRLSRRLLAVSGVWAEDPDGRGWVGTLPPVGACSARFVLSHPRQGVLGRWGVWDSEPAALERISPEDRAEVGGLLAQLLLEVDPPLPEPGQVLGALPLELTVFDAEERVLYISATVVQDAALRRACVGRSREQVQRMLGYPESSLERWRTQLEVLRRTGERVAWEERLDGPPGQREVNLALEPILDPSGQLVQIVASCQDLSAERRAQRAQQEATALYQSLFENSREGIYRSTPQGTLLRSNPSLTRMCGFASEAEYLAAVGDQVGDWYVQPGRSAEFMALLEREGRLEHFESEVWLLGSGQRIWISESATAVYGASGEIMYIEGMVQDISARKHAEAELLREKTLLERIIQTSPNPIFVRDGAGQLVLFNDALLAINGLTRQELIDGPQDLHPDNAEQREFWLARDREVLERGEVQSCEEFLTLRSGEVRTYRTVRAPLEREDGNVQVLGISTDITELRRLTQEREAALTDYKDLFEHATEGIYRSTLAGQMLRANPALVQFNGCLSEQDLLEGVADIARQWYVQPGRRGEFLAALERDGWLHNFESEVYRFGSRERVWISESARMVHDASGSPLYIEGTVQDITARKVAEAELQRERNLLESVIQTSPNPIFVRDAGGSMVLVNEALLRLNGWTREQYRDFEAPLRHALPSDLAQWLEHDRRVLERRETMTFEEHSNRPGEPPRIFSVVKAPLEREDGSVQVLGIMNDITELRRGEAWLRRIEQAVESVADSILIFEDRQVVFANRTALEQSGYTLEQLRQGALLHMAPPEVLLPLLESLRDHERYQGEAVLRAADGREVAVLLRSSRIRDTDGQWLGSVVAMTDITERRRMEDELRLIRRAFESSSDAIMVTDQAFRPLFVNPASVAQTGYSLQELRDGALEKMSTDQTNAEIVRALVLDERYQGEGVLHNAQGQTVPVMMRANLIRGDAGQVLGSVMVATDISERKRIERLKDEFVATVSHELRTPLTALHGALSLVQAGALGEVSEVQQPMLEIARHNSERLIALVADLLDMQRMESDSLEFRWAALDLYALLERACQDNAPYAADYAVHFGLEPDVAGLGWVRGDPDRLLQVLANLLSNAVKFSPAGHCVVVRLLERAGRVRVEVEDRGSGVPEGFRDQIFGKFAQADSSSTRSRGGTGLGLAISRAIVQRHGGEIGFTALPVGTCFWFELPALEHGRAEA